MSSALFPMLLGAEWNALDGPVRRMHGDTPRLQAHGEADVSGATNVPARLLRRLLGLPAPGPQRRLDLSIERSGSHETWRRNFAGSQMRSKLAPVGGRLRERLGPMTFRFALCRDHHAIEWQFCGARFAGLPLPRRMLGSVRSRSGSRDGRYTFEVDVRIPWIGNLVSYHGWLEIVDT